MKNHFYGIIGIALLAVNQVNAAIDPGVPSVQGGLQGGVNTTDIAIQTWAGRLLMFLTIPAVIISLILIIIAIIKIIKIRKGKKTNPNLTYTKSILLLLSGVLLVPIMIFIYAVLTVLNSEGKLGTSKPTSPTLQNTSEQMEEQSTPIPESLSPSQGEIGDEEETLENGNTEKESTETKIEITEEQRAKNLSVKEQILNKLKEDELAKKETIKEEEKKIEETPVLDSTDNQLKKMRDSTRITDIKAIEAAVMQFYQDKGAYPSSIEDFVGTSGLSVKDYLMVLRGDPLGLVEINGCKFGYHYEVGLDNQSYRLSTCLEDEENIKKSASNSYDGGIDNNKFERGINLKGKFDTGFYIVNNNVITIEETDSNRIMNPDISLYTNFDMTDNASDTRNYKRKSDVSIIAGEITVKLAMGAKITDFVKIERTGTTTINGNEVIVSQGVVNFEKLGLNREDYLDPLTKKDYIIAFAETQVNGLTLAGLPNTFTEIFYEVGCMGEGKGIISAGKLGNLEHLIVFSD